MYTAILVLFSRLGDRLISILGFYVLSKYLNFKANIATFITNVKPDFNDKYDINLFNFSNDLIFDNDFDLIFRYKEPPSFSPIKVFNFLKKNGINISFEQLSNDYVRCAKQIFKPSPVILNNIPQGLEDVYGIHLRKSDNDTNLIIENMLNDVKRIIDTENNPKFLIVSEDNEWKLEISNIILEYANKNNKRIELVNINYEIGIYYFNYEAVLDFFCLSRCKEILMGVKYSSFSIMAAIIGNNKLRNYFNYDKENYDNCLIHCFSSMIEINNNKNFDVDYHTRITNHIQDFQIQQKS
jgi:hypothetical protein